MLENTDTKRLKDIYSLLYSNNPDRLGRSEIIREIKSTIKDAGYDGTNNSENIYWFCKGLKLAPPHPPTRYDSTDTYLFNNIKNLITKRRRANDDMKVIKNRVNFKQFYINQNTEVQKKFVKKIIDNLKSSPEDWQIDFDILTDEGKNMLFEPLKEYMENEMGKLSSSNQYKIQFNVNGEWHSKPLTPEVYNQLLANFDLKHFIFDLENKPPEYFYEAGHMTLPEWSLFSSLKLSRLANSSRNEYNDRGAAFFKYLVKSEVPTSIKNYLIRLQIFESLTNKNGKQREELNDCCFVYALKQTGCYNEETLNQIRLRIQNRYLHQNALQKLCEEYNIHLNLSYIDEESAGKNKKQSIKTTIEGKRRSFLGVIEGQTHKFNIFQKHYFIEEQTPISTYYLKNWMKLNDDTKFDKEFNSNHWRKARNFVTSSTLVRTLFKQECFEPITFSVYSILNTIFYNEIESDVRDISLDYNPKFCTQLIKPHSYPKLTKFEVSYWYCDFEADCTQKVHKPYLCVLHSEDGKIKKGFKGEKCNSLLLDYLPNGSIVYFHNLAYDIRMILNGEVNCFILKSIIKGNKTFNMNILYKNKKIYFKDTMPILTCPLSHLPAMFDLGLNIQKEIFPYEYYTYDRLSKGIGKINEAGKLFTKDQLQLFKTNIDKINGCKINDDEFDMWKYCMFYCNQDVNILRLAFNKFRIGFIKDFNIDPFKFVSISSLANEVFNQKVYYNKNLYKIGGVVRKFCSHAIYGGRCMTAFNKKWHITEKLYDFDAVSLHSSAMARLYTVEGEPQVIQNHQLNLDFLNNQSAYIVEILITKINKHYPFPLIVKRTINGNLNDDHLMEGEELKMFVDNISLEDLITFQKIEYKIIRGYYWPGKKDYTIQKVIREIFNKRLEYKENNNPLENLYKLIMNSCYGKTIERPVEKDYKYFHEGDDLDKYWRKNYNKILEDIKLNKSTIHAVRTLKPIDKHFNFSLLGIQILSMAKRIMNEVMCLAYDIGCHIYYQDCDSIHIECNDLPKLITNYEKIYGRKLIGNQLGQFHSDFPKINNHDEKPISIESYFLMKKMYIDKLQDSTGETDYHFRGKGLTKNSIKYVTNEKFNGDMMMLYKYIYDGHKQEFDLTKGQPCFHMNKNMTVSTIEIFTRKIKTNYEEGLREKYFEY